MDNIQELLKPRYKVIEDYPFSDCKLGEIFTEGKLEAAFFNNLSKYPHLFRKLEWWEERDEKDMPEYLRTTEHGEKFVQPGIMKVMYYTGKGGIKDHVRLDTGTDETAGTLFWFLPATKAEYEAFKQQSNG
jgi:hypothetical protein